MATESPAASVGPVEAAVGVADATAATAEEWGRSDLAQRLRQASAATKRPATAVCIVGEFKQGKSSLINGVLGQAVCPVDDDVATAVITLVHHRARLQAAVHRRRDGRRVTETLDPARLPEVVRETDDRTGIERVDVGMPHPVLATGLSFVDTPGTGGLSPAAAVATLTFLPYVDALLFVSDASAELSGPEGEFLRRAADVCPRVIFCLTKVDLYPEWRRIAELDAEHLASLGVEAAMVPLSSTLREVALARQDSGLNDESGFPQLLRRVDDDVLQRARRLAASEALRAVDDVVGQLVSSYETEERLLQDDSSVEDTLHDLEHARARLDHLRGAGARWSVVLNDRVADLSNDVGHRFRAALRSVSADLDGQVEKLKSPRDWDVLSAHLQFRVAEAVAGVFDHLTTTVDSIRGEIVGVLQEEGLELPTPARERRSFDVGALWTERPLDQREGTKVGRGVGQGWSAVRGGAGSLITFGIMAQFLPAAAAALIVSAPVALGLGVAFGGQHALTQRKQKVAARRQQARVAVRQFLDEVQFEVTNQLTEMIRDAQRELRDGFGDRVAELMRTYAETAQQAEANSRRDEGDRTARAGEVAQRLMHLHELRRRTREAQARL
ncbi:MAG: dynamin family protein [Actinomycetota bacterium]